MMRVLKLSRIRDPLPWTALTLDIVGLVIRAALTFRVAKLATYQWYQKMVEKEFISQDDS